MNDKFAILIQFLQEHPELFSSRSPNERALFETNFSLLQERLKEKFINSRQPKTPQCPNTVPDDVVSIVLHEYFGIDTARLNDIKRDHQLSMGAENIVGELLERYIANILEPAGWVWCSGDFIKAIDFLKRDPINNQWMALQVKNRDNTENSSSSAIRNGTAIQKWFRTFSKTGQFNWSAFPGNTENQLSEEGFKQFVINYLRTIRRNNLF